MTRGILDLRGTHHRGHGCRWAALAALALAAVAALPCADAVAGPTPEEYVAHVGGDAKLIGAGELKLDGRKVLCGQRPTVLDNNLDDYGAAYPGFLILNPKLLGRVSTPVKLWIHAHECGHQFRGPDEETADCFAVQRGRRQGWLTPRGAGGGVPLHLPRQGRRHALLRLTPLRGHAPSATSTPASSAPHSPERNSYARDAATLPVSQPIRARLRVRPQW